MAARDRFTRRSVLGAGAALSGGVLAAACAPPRPGPVSPDATQRSERRRVVVVGTGFGGAVTALRLAQRGVDVTLVERGKRWASGTRGAFPTMFAPDRRVSWLSEANTATEKLFPAPPWQRYTGLLERIPGDGMDVMCAAAVGGGSVPYHGMSVQPRSDLFDRVMPGALDYDEFDQRWYPMVIDALGASPLPDDVLASTRYSSSRLFMDIVRDAGLPEATRTPMPVDWDVVRRELRGELPAVISRGDVIYGANGPGKRSLDTNYIPAAEATGRVELLAQHQVQRVQRGGDGTWVVSTDRLDTDGVVQEFVEITSDALFLCAGSANTTKLLVRAAALGDIPDLPDDTGAWWSTNGDLLTTQILDQPTGTFQGGPASIASYDLDDPEGPVAVLFGPIPLPFEANAMEVVGIFIPDGHGRFTYDPRRDEARLRFPPEAHGASLAMARRRIARWGRAAGTLTSIDMTARDPATYHPLGGAVIGKVCDAYGRVMDQPGLYVNDGALIPGSTACANPSLTIAALAERNAAHIVANDVDVLF
ncbi:MAG: GMC family oxidoreductase [Actinomycetia bacterium]|nr:GMC family oxidoreductase [Actinomycetes bacterium]